jgi:hypothetical protein
MKDFRKIHVWQKALDGALSRNSPISVKSSAVENKSTDK